MNAREKAGFRFLDQEWQQVGPLAAEAFYQQAQRLARLVGVQDLQFFPRQAPVLSLVFSARLLVALDLISKLSRMIGGLQFSACLMEAVPAGVMVRLELNRSSAHSLPVYFDSELLLQPIDRLLAPFISPALASDFGPAFCPPRR